MTTEYQQSFESLINSFEGKLTDADQELIHIILGEPSEAVYLSSAELASKAAVHASTVVRLARKLGFDGFILPQERQLPMCHTREDILIVRN